MFLKKIELAHVYRKSCLTILRYATGILTMIKLYVVRYYCQILKLCKHEIRYKILLVNISLQIIHKIINLYEEHRIIHI